MSTSRSRRGGSRPGAGRKPIGAAIQVRLPAHVIAYWCDEAANGGLSANVRRALQDVAEGNAAIIAAGKEEYAAVYKWLVARLQDIRSDDEPGLWQWLNALASAMADAQRRGRRE